MRSQSKLARHMLTHSKEKVHNCYNNCYQYYQKQTNICGYSFVQSVAITIVINITKGKQIFVADFAIIVINITKSKQTFAALPLFKVFKRACTKTGKHIRWGSDTKNFASCSRNILLFMLRMRYDMI